MLFKCFFHIDNLFFQIFFHCFVPTPKMQSIPTSLSHRIPFFIHVAGFFPPTPLFTLCLCLFSTTSAEESPSKDEKQMGSKNIPLLVHCFVHGSVPFLGEQSNWHHSHPCGTGQGCYVAQATIPNCVLGCWANKMDFFLPVCLKVAAAWWHWTQVTATASEALRKPHQAALHTKTRQSYRKPHLFCSLSREQ